MKGHPMDCWDVNEFPMPRKLLYDIYLIMIDYLYIPWVVPFPVTVANEGL